MLSRINDLEDTIKKIVRQKYVDVIYNSNIISDIKVNSILLYTQNDNKKLFAEVEVLLTISSTAPYSVKMKVNYDSNSKLMVIEDETSSLRIPVFVDVEEREGSA